MRTDRGVNGVRVRIVLAATGLAALLLAGAEAFLRLRLWEQGLWSEVGKGRFSSVAWATALLAASLYPARSLAMAGVLAAAGLLYTMVAVGLWSTLGAVYWLAGAWCLGRLILRAWGVEREENGGFWALENAAGLAAVSLVVGVTAWAPIHKSWVHLSWPAVFLLAEGRRARELVRWLRGLEWKKPCSPLTYVVAALTTFLLIAHWQAALMPEISADGLAMHLAIAAWMKAHASFHFDVTRALWAVSPMGGDWIYASAYLVGGEAAARLVNFACLVWLAVLAYSLGRRWARPWAALLGTGLLLSTPVVYLGTGSLFVENIWTLFLLAAVLAWDQGRQTGRPGWTALSGALAGAGVAAKFGALFCWIALMAAMWLAPRERGRKAGGHWLGALLFVVTAAPPYVTAWVRTGNPVFPYFNHVFKSPWMDSTQPFRDARWRGYLKPDVLYQITFQSHRFLESMDGVAGFHLFVLWPLVVFFLRKKLPGWIWVSLIASPLMLAMVFSSVAYLRYIYPVYVLVGLLAGWMLEEALRLNRWLGSALAGTGLVCTALNAFFLGGSGWYNKVFALNPVMYPGEREQFLDSSAPQRKIIRYLNQVAPGEPVALLEDSGTAELLGQAYLNSWHTLDFLLMLRRVQTIEELREELDRRGIRYMVAAVEGDHIRSNFVVAEYLAKVCGEKVFQVGRLGVVKLRENCPPPEAEAETGGRREGAAKAESRESGAASPRVPTAGTGEAGTEETVDDHDRRIRYEGPWYKDRQFRQAVGGTLTYTDQAGAAMEMEFEGTAIRWVFTRAFNRGKARVKVDGKEVAILDLYGPEVQWQQAHTVQELEPGRHVLRIEVLGERNPESRGSYVDVDAFLVSRGKADR